MTTPLGCKDIGIIKSKFVAKTQFLYNNCGKWLGLKYGLCLRIACRIPNGTFCAFI